jgi:hypothetical protein
MARYRDDFTFALFKDIVSAAVVTPVSRRTELHTNWQWNIRKENAFVCFKTPSQTSPDRGNGKISVKVIMGKKHLRIIQSLTSTPSIWSIKWLDWEIGVRFTETEGIFVSPWCPGCHWEPSILLPKDNYGLSSWHFKSIRWWSQESWSCTSTPHRFS